MKPRISLESNHARLAALRDRRTGDLFASGPDGSEDLTLVGERVPDLPTFAQRLEQATAELQRSEPEAGLLF